METVRTQLKQPLPALLSTRGTRNENRPACSDLANPKFFHYWQSFTTDTKEYIKNVNLRQRVPKLDPSPEFVSVSDESTLSARFFQNIGHILGRAWSKSSIEGLDNLRFHDPHGIERLLQESLCGGSIPDIVISDVGRMKRPKIIGNLALPWALELEETSLQNRCSLEKLERPLGPLIKHMRLLWLEYSFLSTYEYTIFIRRKSNDAFEVSDPIHYSSQNPSVREYFFYFGYLAANFFIDFKKRPHDTFEFISNQLGLSEGRSLRPITPEPSHNIDESKIAISKIPPDSILFGDSTAITGIVELTKCLSRHRNGKMTAEGIWRSEAVIVKYWPEGFDDYDRIFAFRNEVSIYKMLAPSRFIPTLLDYGKVMLAKDLADGNIAILRKERGETLSREMWERFSEEEKLELRKDLIKAHEFLREYGLRQTDPWAGNILVKEDMKVVLLDMETMASCSRDTPADEPEVKQILLSVT